MEWRTKIGGRIQSMSGRFGGDVRFFETLFSVGTTCGLSDAQLLERFVSRRDETAESAFESLVLRHGPMVFDICLKILGNVHDAQDAFQATFLILATKARSIIRQGSVGSWLHGVALRVARRARSDAAKRKVHERELAEMTIGEAGPNTLENCHDIEVLHEEVERLPRKYREAVVLCYLEGMSLDAAAGQLGCPIGTIGVRLMRARERLKVRLSRRGMSVPAGLLVAGHSVRSASAALPAALVGSTVKAAIGNATGAIVSLAAARLSSEVLRSMFMIKLAKISAGLLVAMVAVGSFGGILAHSGKLMARETRNERPNQAPASWIGKKVVTKYGAPLRVGNQVAAADGFFRVFTVQEVDGEQVRLGSEGVDGWIESTEIVLLDQAIDFYSQEIRSKPKSSAAYHQRGLIWQFNEQNDKAIADYTEAIRLDPNDVLSYANRGDIFRERKEYDKAIADCTEAVRIDPRNAIAFIDRGRAWSGKQEHDKAIADFNEAIRIDPKFVWAYNDRGLAWFIKHEYDKAIADFNEAVRIDPRNAIAFNDRGRAWSAKREHNKAIADFDEAVRIDPKFVWAHINRGDAWFNKHEYDKAIADFTEAVRIDPRNAIASNDRGRAWSGKREHNKAIADFDEAIRIDPKFVWAHINRGDAWFNKHEYDKAIADYNEAIRIDPKFAWAYTSRGFAWSDKKEYDKAIADHTEAIRIDPNNPSAYSHRGLAWSFKEDYDKAIADFTEAIRIDPNNPLAYSNRGLAWSYKQEYDKAITDFTEAIRIDPKSAWAHKSRGFAWSNKNEYDKAIADHTEAIRIDPESPDSYNFRAWIWATCPEPKHRDGKKAVESATRACELTEWNAPNYLETLAAACAEAGDFESAVKWQTKANALRADPEGRTAGESRLKLYQEKKTYRDAGA